MINIDNFSKTFTELGCEVRALQLATKEYPYEEIQETISWADLIYVGGGAVAVKNFTSAGVVSKGDIRKLGIGMELRVRKALEK